MAEDLYAELALMKRALRVAARLLTRASAGQLTSAEKLLAPIVWYEELIETARRESEGDRGHEWN